KDFSPRFSLNYSLDSRTVLRAGYGIFFARFHGNMLDTLWLGGGKYQTQISVSASQAGAPSFPNILPSPTAAGTIKLEFAAPDLPNPHTQQRPVPPEHNSTHNTPLPASYIWARGIALYTQRDLTLGAPAGNKPYLTQAASNNTVGPFTPPFYVIGNRLD